MTPDDYALDFMFDLTSHALLSDRAMQSGIGASDLGTCRQRVAYRLRGIAPSDAPEKWAAITGNYMDAGFKAARKAAKPHLLHDVRYQVTLPNGTSFWCSLDELDPQEPAYTDGKTKDAAGLAKVRKYGSDDKDRYQRHVNYLAAVQAGVVPPEGIVRNIYLDRSGKDSRPHVEQEPFSMDVVREAEAWLEDSQYAADHGEDAQRDWERPQCERYCEFFGRCRGADRVDEVYLTGRGAEAVARFVDVKTRAAEYQALYDALRDELKGVTGRSDTHWVKSTVMNTKTGAIRVDAGIIEGAKVA